uniref:Uncharacterized protein n=1 Tax=Rhizophora mucronata TaxID=61149 RepID=A0A2P2PP44_RHIMU
MIPPSFCLVRWNLCVSFCRIFLGCVNNAWWILIHLQYPVLGNIVGLFFFFFFDGAVRIRVFKQTLGKELFWGLIWRGDLEFLMQENLSILQRVRLRSHGLQRLFLSLSDKKRI